jgi:copper chaperone CopZ
MKRMLSLTLALVALVAFVTAPAVSVAGSCGSKSSDLHQMSAKGQCTPEHAAACAAKLGISPEECQKLCASGEYTHVNMSIKGMTCTGCENTITTCLQALPGVVKVGVVSYKDGTAFVLVDPKKVTNEDLVTAINDKGYKAEVIPAVSVTPAGAQTVGAQHPCGAAAASACAKKCAKPCGAATPKTDKTDKSDKGGGSH